MKGTETAMEEKLNREGGKEKMKMRGLTKTLVEK